MPFQKIFKTGYYGILRIVSFFDPRSAVTAQKLKETADLVTFTEEILHRKLQFFCAVYAPYVYIQVVRRPSCVSFI